LNLSEPSSHFTILFIVHGVELTISSNGGILGFSACFHNSPEYFNLTIPWLSWCTYLFRSICNNRIGFPALGAVQRATSCNVTGRPDFCAVMVPLGANPCQIIFAEDSTNFYTMRAVHSHRLRPLPLGRLTRGIAGSVVLEDCRDEDLPFDCRESCTARGVVAA